THAGGWRLWRFEPGRKGPRLDRTEEGPEDKPVPGQLATKSFRHLWQPLLNVAWLPVDQVFLRVVELPACEADEVPMMVEFEIERLSPLPVADIYWTCELLPAVAGERRTVIVIMAAREVVDGFIETSTRFGYLADRLDLPQVRELLARPVLPESAWLFARQDGGRLSCLLAWWAKGRLRYLELRVFENQAAALTALEASLQSLAWSAEIEGWTGPRTRWQLSADDETASWLKPLLERSVGPVDLHAAMPGAELATHSAGAETRANLLPAGEVARNRQQFVDRLWMRAVSMMALVYVLGVLGYFAFLNIQDYRKSGTEYEIAVLHQSYTNALALRAKVEVLRNQIDLKFAALDCLKAASDSLPADMTLTSFDFQRGRRLNLFGTVPANLQSRVAEFTEALGDTEVNGEALFSRVTTKAIQAQPGRPASWTIECELKRQESP
ncbi:MAG: hypothetical protein KDM81_00560, partial [Verrucomicrobiae bacterium]|nr:hypothetical protein [Verrucomicrobiae bacterium]